MVKSKNIKECDKLFARVFPTCQFCLNILLADQKGNNIGSAVNPEIAHKLNFLDKDWFIDGMKGKILIHQPHVSKLFKVNTFMITHPVLDGNYQSAVLGIPINLSKISEELVSSYPISTNSNITIVNDNGVIMFNYRNSEKVGKKIDKEGVFKQIFLKEEGYYYKNETDSKRLVVFDTLTKYDWKVIIETTEDAILSGVSERLKNNLITLSSLFILSFLLVIWISKKIGGNFRLLMAGIDSFGAGNMTFRFNTEGVRGEFKEIFSTFNQMAHNIFLYESEVNKLNRLYSLLSDINQKIIRYGNKELLLKDITKDIVEIGKYKICFMLEKSENDNNFSMVSYYGIGAESAKKFESGLTNLLKDSIPVQIEKGEMFYKNNISSAENIFENELLMTGFSSYCILPIFFNQAVYYLIVIIGDRDDRFTDDDIKLFKELSLDVGFAIKSYQMNEEKERMDELLTCLFESMGEGLAILDRDLKIVSANRKYMEILEKNKEEVIGRKCYEVFYNFSNPCQIGEEVCNVKDIFEDGEERSKFVKRVTKKGELKYLNIRFYPLKIGNKIRYIIKVVEDITEYKKLEGQYLHAQKMEAVGRLTAGISHDFNNILTGIMGFASIAELKCTDVELKKDIKNIMEISEKAANLTKSLLAFSRKTEYNPKIVNANELLMGYEKILKRVLGENIELKYELSPRPLTVYVDPVQFEQIIMNLATNAIDAMPKGGKLFIQTSKVYLDDRFINVHGFGRKGDYALISLTDTGIGIPKEHIDKIFEPFFTTKEVGKGTGLGLSVVYGIVKNHDGFINVYSELGKGTSFKIYFPLVKAGSETQEHLEEVKTVLNNIKVMILDDEEIVREPLKIALQNLGLNVVACFDGTQALDLVKNQKFDLIITDIMMPHMSGKEFYEKAKLIDPNVKFIFISGYPHDFISEKYQIDLNKVIMKPVSPAYLYRKISEVLSKD